MKNKTNDNQRRVKIYRISTINKEGRKYHSFYLAWYHNEKVYYEAIKPSFVCSLPYLVARASKVESVEEMLEKVKM